MSCLALQTVLKRNVLFVLGASLILNGRSFAGEFVIVDTGQNKCYNESNEITPPEPGEAFFGQDAQYAGVQPSYGVSGDSLTVYDNNTGLTWIRTPDTDGDQDLDTYDQLTWSEFLAYPATLNAQNYGGFDDWRAPTIKELYSLIDFRGLDPSGPNPTDLVPFIDTTYFDFVYGDESVGERLIDAQYWSTTEYVGTVFGGEAAVFGVNFADGRIKGYPRDIGPDGAAVHYVRCVRGDTIYGTNEFTDNEDGTITDNATGLMWSQDDSGDGVSTGPRSGMIWEDALAWVEEKNAENYLGYNDWRLPNAKEMQSIVDYSRAPDATASAAIDPVFNITEITNEAGETDYPWFWTGTTHARSDGAGQAGAYICFGRALGYMGGSWMDVHGAGAQRSDQKDGDFSGYNYVPDGYYFPPAPQGDAARMYNYVRCVREGAVDIDDENPNNKPAEYGLLWSFPNPFASKATIAFSLSEASEVTVRICDLLGRQVATLIDDYLPAGAHQTEWRAEGRYSGVYLCTLNAGQYRDVRRVVLRR